MASGVLVFGEATDDGGLNPVTAELIAAGSNLGGPVSCVLAGAGVEGLAQECVAAGADKVTVVDDPILAPYQGDAYIPMAERIAKEVDPSVVLMGQTMMGRDLAPRRPQRLGTAVATSGRIDRGFFTTIAAERIDRRLFTTVTTKRIDGWFFSAATIEGIDWLGTAVTTSGRIDGRLCSVIATTASEGTE